MSENVPSVTLEILKSIQASISKLDARMSEMDARIDARFGAVEETMRKQRRDTAGILVLMKSVVGTFDERVLHLEQRVTLIEMNNETP